MIKTLLLAAIAAVLCTLGAVSSSPVRLTGATPDWSNVTGVLEQIKENLQLVQAKIYDTEQNVAEGVNKVLQGITNNAQVTAAKWKEPVDELAEEAGKLGVDVQDCILAVQPIYDVADRLVTDVFDCVSPNLDSVSDALSDLHDVRDEAQWLLHRAVTVARKCERSGSSASDCLQGKMPELYSQALGLVDEAVANAGIASANAATLFPALSGTCATGATSSRAAEAAGLVDTATKCIKDRMPQPSPEPQPEPSPEPQPEPSPEPQPEPSPETQP
ncbi:Repellent protein 1 [Frankliniella fusca]|uniref:Repellent protein 1 n=1 Tax=Frankliniella fusca TaxID=407009 RepID=A0AAE1L544_9NEOP|nr:Repellent protein 1 [Frankliniella fusca]